MEYNHKEIEKRWQAYWKEHGTYRTKEDPSRKKFYVLDMFPYPSGAGLHVGHPLGYIASDIYSRYKRLRGYNVLHPMGYDAYGLPAEQYAIQTGQHPEVTGTARCAHARPTTTSGRSGRSSRCSTPITTPRSTRLCRSAGLRSISRSMAPKGSRRHAARS